MDDAQGAVTVVLALDDDAEAVDVRQGRKADRLALQLAPDGIGRLLAPLDPRGQPRLDSTRSISGETASMALPFSSFSASRRRWMATRAVAFRC